jgi:anti-anti-sigma regulatory factor
MSSKEVSPAGRTCIVLPASCTLKEASAVRDLLKDGLEATGDVELDARAVQRVDTSVLQLLASFVRDMGEAGRAVTWAGTNEEFSRSARLLGLEVLLGVDSL